MWRQQQQPVSQPLADLDCGFSGPAEVRGRVLIVDFSGRRGFGAGFGLWIFRPGGGAGPHLDCVFSGPARVRGTDSDFYATNVFRISVVRHKFIQDFCGNCHIFLGFQWYATFSLGFRGTPLFPLGFSWYATNFIRISVVRHIFLGFQ